MESHYCHQNEEVDTYIATERNSVITDDITDVHNMHMWVKPTGFFPESSWCWDGSKFLHFDFLLLALALHCCI